MKANYSCRRALRQLKLKGNIWGRLTVLLLILSVSGCSYYKAKKTDLANPPSNQEIEKLSPAERYVIIHSGDQMMHLSNVTIDEDSKELSGVLTQLNSRHRNIQPVHNKTYRYKRSETDPLNEVHFYTSRTLDFSRTGEEVRIPFAILDSVSVNNPNAGKSVINVVGSTVGVLAVGFAVIALTKSSCPFIYIKDGEEFVFTGELYPGAITPNIQRDDYIPLRNFNPVGNDFIIKVTNELHEVQHTDLVELIKVKHPKDIQVLLDNTGNPHSFTDIRTPKKVFSESLSPGSENVLQQDGVPFMFDGKSPANDGSNNMIVEFSKPAGVKKAKLFLTAKNSFWLDYTFGKFNEQFGFYYNTFQKQQNETPGEESIKWSEEQNIPLSIYLKTSRGWSLVERVNTVGPLAYRDIVVPIDLMGSEGESVVLKFETGFMFWEIDRAGIDFSENIPMEKVVLKPSFAVNEKGENVTEMLKETDGIYLTQPEVGNAAVVTFRDEESHRDQESSLFLKNRGYYTYIRNYKGIPDFAELRTFKEKGRFSLFSKEQYEKFVREEMLDLALTYGN